MPASFDAGVSASLALLLATVFLVALVTKVAAWETTLEWITLLRIPRPVPVTILALVGEACVRACSWCGKPSLPRRATCTEECARQVMAEARKRFALQSSERMRQLAQLPDHPALSTTANEKRRATRKAQRQPRSHGISPIREPIPNISARRFCRDCGTPPHRLWRGRPACRWATSAT
jgi:hypothetical protein